jgi:hypothetical protein
MTWPIAGWSTTLRVIPVHMGAGNAVDGRVWTVRSGSEKRDFHLVAPESAFVIGTEYEVDMTVLTEMPDGGISTARADEVHTLVDMPWEDVKQALREAIDPERAAAFAAQERRP